MNQPFLFTVEKEVLKGLGFLSRLSFFANLQIGKLVNFALPYMGCFCSVSPDET